MISRRTLMTMTSSVALLALAGCSSMARSGLAKQVVDDVAAIAGGLQAVLGPLSTIVGISPSTLATVSNLVSGITAVAQQVSAATTTSAAQPLVQQIEADVNAVVAALASLPLPPQISMALMAAQVLLPLIEAAVNLVITPAPPKAVASGMTPNGARIYLKSIAKS